MLVGNCDVHIFALEVWTIVAMTIRPAGPQVQNVEAAAAGAWMRHGAAGRHRRTVEAAADLTGTATSAAAAGAGARLSAETGRPYTPTAGRETVAGTYRQRLTLTSGRFAMIDNGLGFALVL
jgi:hypothetical protein